MASLSARASAAKGEGAAIFRAEEVPHDKPRAICKSFRSMLCLSKVKQEDIGPQISDTKLFRQIPSFREYIFDCCSIQCLFSYNFANEHSLGLFDTGFPFYFKDKFQPLH